MLALAGALQFGRGDAWVGVVVVGSVVVLALIVVLRDWRLGLVLVPASIAVGALSLVGGVGAMVCHGCGSAGTGLFVGSLVAGAIASYSLALGGRLLWLAIGRRKT